MMSNDPTIADLCALPSAVDGRQKQRTHLAAKAHTNKGTKSLSPLSRQLRPDGYVLPLHHEGKTIRQIAVETDIPAWIVIRTLRKHRLIP